MGKPLVFSAPFNGDLDGKLTVSGDNILLDTANACVIFYDASGALDYNMIGMDGNDFIIARNGTEPTDITDDGSNEFKFSMLYGSLTLDNLNQQNVSGSLVCRELYIGNSRMQLQESYESAAQTITAAGSLTLAHGLGGTPTLVQGVIECTTAEHGYSIGDQLILGTFGESETTNSINGVAIVPDATNLNCRFGSRATVFYVPNKSDGTLENLTNGSWKFIARAWY
jgi:hypothetical protein